MNIGSETTAIEEIAIASYLAEHSDLKEKVQLTRADLTRSYPFIHRLSVALYHAERDVLQTYVSDEDIESNFSNYEAVLSECRSLNQLVVAETERIIHDMSLLPHDKPHSSTIHQAGYLSSVTIPLMIEGHLMGFMFVDSREKNVFHEELLQRLRLISMIFALLLHQSTEKIDVLKSTVESMKIVSFGRDPETAEHQQRMASYSLLIARELAASHHLTDPVINYIYLYAPLHDLGKIMIADDILLKAGRLSKDEYAIMQQHTVKGYELAEKLINVYQLAEGPYISILRAIIRWHHEKMDGSGYPDGLVGEQIPIAVRIVTVADIFDALTSVRPYKKNWTNEAAFKELQKLAVKQLDSDCVSALVNNERQVLRIQKQFKDSY